MSKRAEAVLKEASQLPDSDRVQLIEDLLGTLEPPAGAQPVDPTTLQMLIHIREILRRLRARRAPEDRSSKCDQLEALFGSLRHDPLVRPPQGSVDEFGRVPELRVEDWEVPR